MTGEFPPEWRGVNDLGADLVSEGRAWMGLHGGSRARRRASSVSAARRLPAAQLRAAVERIMEAGGCPSDERATVASLLVEANLYGHDSHGIQMVYKYMKALQSGYVTPGSKPQVRDAGGPMLVVDAKGVWGQIAYREAMELAIAKAKGEGGGVCVLALHNAHHIGRAGHYTEMAAAAGCVAVHFVNAAGAPRARRTIRWLRLAHVH